MPRVLTSEVFERVPEVLVVDGQQPFDHELLVEREVDALADLVRDSFVLARLALIGEVQVDVHHFGVLEPVCVVQEARVLLDLLVCFGYEVHIGVRVELEEPLEVLNVGQALLVAQGKDGRELVVVVLDANVQALRHLVDILDAEQVLEELDAGENLVLGHALRDAVETDLVVDDFL